MTAQRILDISQNDIHLHSSRGFLVVSRHKEKLKSIPLDALDAVIVHAYGATYSNNLLVKLADHGCSFVICGSNHAPKAQMVTLDGYYKQAGRFDQQITHTQRLKGRLWKELIKGKITMQAQTLLLHKKEYAHGLLALAKKVRVGDPQNLEAQAARRYWSSLFGEEFSRKREKPGINAMLNYGYIILRSLVSRHLLAQGFFPALGLHHHNKNNPMRLVDDLMEPLRPFVDNQVYELLQKGENDVSKNTKLHLGTIGHLQVATQKWQGRVITDLNNATEIMIQSLAHVFEGKNQSLTLPAYLKEGELILKIDDE
jgi:CRISPR-associated protein Cas1